MAKQTWLILGGAGYIGAHVADAFLTSGKDLVIYDSLYQGLESRIEFLRKKHGVEIPLIVADIRDVEKLDEVLASMKPYGIVHAAALKAVGESMEKPDLYMEVNLHATTKILKLVKKHGIKHFIFSSSAAVYGSPDHSIPMKESDEVSPISPYGDSKLLAEAEVNKYLDIPGNRGTSLRFFNVVGSAAPELVDNSVENLVPIVINKVKAGEPPVIFGTDYPTKDGTCIRDYVDVRDIAAAHLAAADFEGELPRALNVGTGGGSSVREVIAVVLEAMGKTNVEPVGVGRRAGDSAFLCADVSLIEKTLGYKAQYSLRQSLGI